jgi:TfoX/Sxy family transcriptional regulator of competence genes
MPFDEVLAGRIRAIVQDRPEIDERKMFGGIAFLFRGHMSVGIVGSDLMVRVGPGEYEKALARKHVRPMDFTGRPLKGMVYVAAAGIRTGSTLRAWIERGIAYCETLPAKAAGTRRRPAKRGPRKT